LGIQTDVSDIKVDLRRTNDKIDVTNGRVDVLRDKLEQGFRDVSARMDGLHEKQTEKRESVRQDLSQKIDGVRQDLTQKIEGVREDLTQKIDGVRQDLTQQINGVRQDIASMKVWAMGLYFALAGSLLFVMAKGFKWF
jgi:predicted  nucleic acid-binding Zn-ribbon protein